MPKPELKSSPSARQRSLDLTGVHKRSTVCLYCRNKVDTMLHYELDGTCPKRILYGPQTTEPDDPSYDDQSYKIRRTNIR